MKYLLPVCLITCLSVIQAKADQSVFKIGFDIRYTQLEDARQYQPFLNYLSNTTGYKFELRFTRKNEDIVNPKNTIKTMPNSFIEARESDYAELQRWAMKFGLFREKAK